jgi:Raf kinase inhibitor-like YbhB/YbcL family protein
LKKYLLLLIATATLLSAGSFTLTSHDLEGQLSLKQVFNGFGCSGENVSPELSWSNAPKETKSFAVTAYDPDAPTGSGWWHWVVFNIPATVASLSTNSGNIENGLMPKGAVQSITDYGKAGFGGACPPVGDKAHRYIFTVYALDAEALPLDAGTMPSLVGYMINQHTLQKTSMISYYGR